MAYTQTIEAINRLVATGIVPGVSYAILDGKLQTKGIVGAEQLVPAYEPLKNDQLYDVASLTKVVGTVPVVLQLIESGVLTLNDPISQFLAGWSDRRVTIRHLLTHTSGITGYIPRRDKLSAQELHDALLTLHVGPTFDKQMVYADTNFIFLGWIVEAITGLPIQKAIEQRVLTPLGMGHSTFQPTDPLTCVPTELSSTRGLIRGVVHDPKANVLKSRCGSAGLFATRSDLVTFVQHMMSRDNRPISTDFKQALLKDQTPNQSAFRSFGWALVPVQFPTPHYAIWHSGFTGTFIVIDPQNQQAMVFLSNRVHPKAPNTAFLGARNALITTYLSEKSNNHL
ncbi:serine hydrolase [Secundilactobacillus kimchicus]|uniref:Beta-lactamase class C related penicillin binding protein n=1 Tax=Secundilactobacillus kimchicus JCM 15530 TaxID=1302272 RepID=A0A0R1HWH2_9LACO|nr:serine hydrolase domain-containing protein [Secundilactobacillus kimchicus]KRK48212.1 Beta-lactamase class C related penicillin binding protein [Secundilactobacillus kimchicus JCM 15530]MBT9670827.1 serine hydrolase [Secundilactobacillus kimchicus]